MPWSKATLSGLPWSVDVGAVFDGHDVDAAVLVVDTVDHPVVAPAGAVQPFEPELERLAGSVGVAASDPYRNSTAAVATFSGNRASARRVGQVEDTVAALAGFTLVTEASVGIRWMTSAGSAGDGFELISVPARRDDVTDQSGAHSSVRNS